MKPETRTKTIQRWMLHAKRRVSPCSCRFVEDYRSQLGWRAVFTCEAHRV